MNERIGQTREIVSQFGFLPIIVLVTFISLYVFWRESKFTGKNQNSIFDCFVISLISVVIWGRLSYLLSSPQSLDGLIWSAFPYERYPDGFYLFRLLPWRYFRIWDGEFLLSGLFVGLVFSTFVYSTFVKRWRWREMMGAVISSGSIYFGGLLFFLGFISQADSILQQSLTILALTIGYLVLARMLARVLNRKDPKNWERLNYFLIFLYTLIVSIYIPSALLKSDITVWDRYNMYAFCVFSVVSLCFYIFDVIRKEVKIKTHYRSRSVLISTNQPIKL